MTDGIVKGTGNSILLKTTSDFLTRYPTYEEFVAAFIAGNIPVDLSYNGTGWQVQGTPLNKANLLSSATEALLGLTNSTPNAAIAALASRGQWEDVTDGDIYVTAKMSDNTQKDLNVDVMLRRKTGVFSREYFVVAHTVSIGGAFKGIEIGVPSADEQDFFNLASGIVSVRAAEHRDDLEGVSSIAPIASATTNSIYYCGAAFPSPLTYVNPLIIASFETFVRWEDEQ